MGQELSGPVDIVILNFFQTLAKDKIFAMDCSLNRTSKLKLEANDEEIWTVMKINLPFQVEERFFSDGSITGYHLARVNNKLMMFLELIGVRSNFKAQYKGKGFQNIGFVLSPEGAQDQGNLCGNEANAPVQQPQQDNEQTMHESILRNIQA